MGVSKGSCECIYYLKSLSNFAWMEGYMYTAQKGNLCMQISEKTGKPVTDVKNAIIWGNHSSTQYPDVNHGTVGGQPIRQAVKDDEWLNGEFISTVQQRGAAIIKASPSARLQALQTVCQDILHMCDPSSVPDRVNMHEASPEGQCCRHPGLTMGLSKGLLKSPWTFHKMERSDRSDISLRWDVVATMPMFTVV